MVEAVYLFLIHYDVQARNHRVKLVQATPESYNDLAEPSCEENVHLFPGDTF